MQYCRHTIVKNALLQNHYNKLIWTNYIGNGSCCEVKPGERVTVVWSSRTDDPEHVSVIMRFIFCPLIHWIRPLSLTLTLSLALSLSLSLFLSMAFWPWTMDYGLFWMAFCHRSSPLIEYLCSQIRLHNFWALHLFGFKSSLFRL